MELGMESSGEPSNERAFDHGDQSTPERLTSVISVQEVSNKFSKLLLLDSPKSRLDPCHGLRSRLNTASKGKVLFPKKNENLRWSDREEYALVLFLLLFTDGQTWVAHKDKKFWTDAGEFIQRYTRTPNCRTGN